MKLGEAQRVYQAQYSGLIDKQRELYKKKEKLQQKIDGASDGEEAYADEAATLELSIQNVNDLVEENRDFLDQAAEKYSAAWNAEVARQQSDPDNGIGAELSKIMATVRRIASGARVPATDEKKVMEYDAKLYSMAKQMALMKKNDKKYKSLWEDKDKNEYDPEAAAENAGTDGLEMPELLDTGDAGTADTGSGDAGSGDAGAGEGN